MAMTTRKWFSIILLFSITMSFLLFILLQTYYYVSSARHRLGNYKNPIEVAKFERYSQGKWREFGAEQVATLSNLGKILYLDYNPPVVNTSAKNYAILIWKYGLKLERKLFKHYTDHRFDPFENCSVKNCYITYNSSDLKSADLVLFYLYETKGVHELPKGERDPQQIWTFLTAESPFNTFRWSKNNSMKNYNGLFNWSMTYRMDSDIPVPYGRTILLKSGESGVEEKLYIWNKSKKQDVLVAIMDSDCGEKNNSWKYVKELKKHIPVNIYGRCEPLECPGHSKKDCDEISKYKFYLSFEKSNCDEYITEKLWLNGFAKNAVPIVMGGSKHSYQQLLPPNSYINVEDFARPRDLANYIMYVNKFPSELEQYFSWKRYFKVVNEHAHYCRLCEALNYNCKETKVYTDLKQFWNCHASWNVYS